MRLFVAAALAIVVGCAPLEGPGDDLVSRMVAGDSDALGELIRQNEETISAEWRGASEFFLSESYLRHFATGSGNLGPDGQELAWAYACHSVSSGEILVFEPTGALVRRFDSGCAGNATARDVDGDGSNELVISYSNTSAGGIGEWTFWELILFYDGTAFRGSIGIVTEGSWPLYFSHSCMGAGDDCDFELNGSLIDVDRRYQDSLLVKEAGREIAVLRTEHLAVDALGGGPLLASALPPELEQKISRAFGAPVDQTRESDVGHWYWNQALHCYEAVGTELRTMLFPTSGGCFAASDALAQDAETAPEAVRTQFSPDGIQALHARAEKGDAEAQSSLGDIYREGLGVDRDAELATQWYTRAAENCHVGAMFSLGAMFAGGDGVPQDDTDAYVWYSRAGAGGDALADEKRQETALFMTAAEYRRARDLLEARSNACEPLR